MTGGPRGTAWAVAFREALPPATVALAVTLLRLAGERLGWSATWFSRDTGSVVPSRLGWVVGITWLALPFGAWLGWRRLLAGDRPAAAGRALLQALAALVLFYLMMRLMPLPLGFPGFLFPIWATAVLAAWIAWRAWPGLGRTLLAYGVLSRLAVVIVMFLALRGHWGTHYDYADASALVGRMSLVSAFFWLALVPQMVFWVGYTVILGMVGGTLLAALARRKVPAVSTVSIAGVLLASLAASASAAPPTAGGPQEAAAARVREREQAFARTMAERDWKAFSSFVSEQAVFLGRRVLRGRQAVADGWKPYFEGKAAPFSWQPETVEVIDSGTLALSRGPVFDPQGKRTSTFTSTWRLEKDGEWRVVLDSGCPPCACP